MEVAARQDYDLEFDFPSTPSPKKMLQRILPPVICFLSTLTFLLMPSWPMGPFLPGQLPLAELASMISINNIHADTPVFMLSTASGIWTPLQKSDFEKWVNSTLEALGLTRLVPLFRPFFPWRMRPPTSLRREEQAPPVLTHFCRPPKQSSIFSILKIVAVISKIQRLCTKLNSCWASLQSPQATPVKL